jgi:hypothetical protein
MELFVDSDYGNMVRNRFQDVRGTSELAMLAAPTAEELDQLKRAVAIMTPDEKENAAELTDEQIQRIADDARVDPGNLAIFFNGYALHCKRVS